MNSNQNDDQPEQSLDNEYKEKYLRALADYQNLEKQTETWRDEFVTYANAGLIRKLLEVLDDLENAQEHLQDEGLKLIIGKLQNILKESGVEEIEILDKVFDPNLAEVVSTEPFAEAQGEPGENKVSKILQKGYMIKDKVIRVAKVNVWAKL